MSTFARKSKLTLLQILKIYLPCFLLLFSTLSKATDYNIDYYYTSICDQQVAGICLVLQPNPHGAQFPKYYAIKKDGTNNYVQVFSDWIISATYTSTSWNQYFIYSPGINAGDMIHVGLSWPPGNNEQLTDNFWVDAAHHRINCQIIRGLILHHSGTNKLTVINPDSFNIRILNSSIEYYTQHQDLSTLNSYIQRKPMAASFLKFENQLAANDSTNVSFTPPQNALYAVATLELENQQGIKKVIWMEFDLEQKNHLTNQLQNCCPSEFLMIGLSIIIIIMSGYIIKMIKSNNNK